MREEIAKIDDQLAEAQAGASTELTGNTRAAIENRKVFRDLLGSYEDYVSALASAGASQEQIQAVISQLNGDFQDQASALGYNSGELQVYGERFNDLATIVAGVPRDVTVAFNGDPALQALAEFYAKAEEQARTAGQNIGNAIGDGLGSGLGGAGGGGIPDFGPILEKGLQETRPRNKGENWFRDFIEGVKTRPFNLIPIVGPYLTEFIETGSVTGQEWTGGFGEGLRSGLQNIDPTGELYNASIPRAGRDGGALGSIFGGSFGQGVQGGVGDPLNAWIQAQNANAYGNGRNIGANIGGGIAAGLAAALGGRKVGATFEKGYSGGGLVGAGLFAGGGYTGSGHWLEPAGIVHRGEYVVPKKHVNQATGLPDLSYLANLQRGSSAPRSGYANGGYVGTSGQNGPIELGPASLRTISNALSVSLNVGQTRLAQSVSRGNETLSFTGSN